VNKFKESPIGAVYLRRTGDGKVEALNVVCRMWVFCGFYGG